MRVTHPQLYPSVNAIKTHLYTGKRTFILPSELTLFKTPKNFKMLLLAPSIFCVCVALGAIKQLVKAYKDINVFPSTVPWAGVRKERFWKVKACLRELFAGLKTLQLGYEQVRQIKINPDR